MLAATYLGPKKVRADKVPDAALRQPTDCVVRSTLTAICGSDLHTYHGANEKYQTGAGNPPILGHEFVGIVEEVGSAVTQFKKGDRVTGAFRSACGRCDLCRRGYPSKCPYGEFLGLNTPGAQAEAVRVGFADYSLAVVPDKVPDEHAIFAGDNLSTGMQAAAYGEIKPGDTVAVFGCGPVGLFAQQASLLHGASVVFAIDRAPARLELARKFGSTPINAGNGDAVAQIRELTKGRGVDVAIEAVGLPQTIADAFNSIRPYGMVSIVGVSEAETMPLPIRSIYMNGTRLAIGTCSVQNHIHGALKLMAEGRINAAPFADTKIPLQSVAEGYQRFDSDKSVFKVLMHP
ncbi:MAG TPA: alcohol dehydrogenase catalytic domain-containing protein [Candidatus Sulfotelmatobacter sp.]|nr:alcohol dehydrogenase catalytic domain-containing protein [Candidatus Sulfotelmatobacter sp.]